MKPASARAAAFAAGPAPIPRKTVVVGGAVLLAIGLTGALLDKVFVHPGAPPPKTAIAPAPRNALRIVKVPLASLPGGAPLAHLLGTDALAGKRAPALSLLAQQGRRVRLADLRGDAIVLSFLDSACDDECPVVGPELAAADRLLGARAQRVRFLTVNTDPLRTAFSPAPPVFTRTGLAGLKNAEFLTGTIHALNPIWTEYGVTIDVASTGRIAHSDLVYLIDPRGRLRYRITPPASESRRGTYSLPAPERARVAKAIATYTASLFSAPKHTG